MILSWATPLLALVSGSFQLLEMNNLQLQDSSSMTNTGTFPHFAQTSLERQFPKPWSEVC